MNDMKTITGVKSPAILELATLEKLPESSSNGPDWLVQLRRESQDSYNQAPLPLRSAHLWRYTDPNQFLFADSASPETESSAKDGTMISALEDLKNGSLAAVGFDNAGSGILTELSEKARSKGLIVMSLREAAEALPEIFQRHYGAAVPNSFGKFEALNGSLWQDGLLVYVPKGLRLSEPVHLLHRGSSESGWTYNRTLVVADEGSEVTVIDEYFSADEDVKAKSNSVVEVIGLDHSQVNYVALQRNNRHSLSFHTQRTVIHDASKSVLVAASFGGKTHKANLGTVLRGKRAESEQFGLVFASGKQRQDHHTDHIHEGANGHSNIDFKVVASGRSSSAYTGLIRVELDAPGCEAYQSNRNLLLNRGASAESIPELEILCDEVICTHGATVGPIDEMQLFYLMGRGAPREEAIRMLIEGHIEPTISRIPETLRDRVREYVAQRLEAL